MQVNGLSMVQPSNDYQMLGTFETKVSVHKGLGPAGGTTLFNLFSDASDNKIQEAIRKEVQSRGGTAAINVKITWGADPVQLFLNMLTLTLYAPATATISGTVIKDK
jgi:hypothetical protein